MKIMRMIRLFISNCPMFEKNYLSLHAPVSFVVMIDQLRFSLGFV